MFRGFAAAKSVGATWIEHAGRVYGAEPDERGPIGGGEGYYDILTTGDYQVDNEDGLLAALSRVREGETIFIAEDAVLDFTTLVYIEQLVLALPAGVTLASSRGRKGSTGALLFSDAFATKPLLLATGPGVRITGLRLYGPDAERRLYHHKRSFADQRGHSYYYQFPTSVGVQTESDGLAIDNCELAGFSLAAVHIQGGERSHIHHNYIHHCQRQGLGYGVSGGTETLRIERNLFDFNRHSIASSGRPGTGYTAEHNVELGDSLGHCFDMHGGHDRKDGGDTAGRSIRIRHNTFFVKSNQTPIVIRGIPEQSAEIHNNWFPHHKPRVGLGDHSQYGLQTGDAVRLLKADNPAAGPAERRCEIGNNYAANGPW